MSDQTALSTGGEIDAEIIVSNITRTIALCAYAMDGAVYGTPKGLEDSLDPFLVFIGVADLLEASAKKLDALLES